MIAAFRRWFAGSFWVDVHYATAAIASIVAIVRRPFDPALAGFAVASWIAAAGNDKVNMPPVGP